MQLFVCVQAVHTLKVTGQETICQIKAYAASMEDIAPEEQVLLLGGSPLEDEAILGQCGVEPLSTPEVTAWLLGGKVHGSLKKEEEEEKEKKKRMQYNQCFVNVMPTLGKKKGPNANS